MVDSEDRYWYFCKKDRKLRYGDGRRVEVGFVHTVEPPLELCSHGLHASKRPLDALKYAPGFVACEVALGGHIQSGKDKACATYREYLSVTDVQDVIERFARRCALDAINKAKTPWIVYKWLKTGNPGLLDKVRRGFLGVAQPISGLRGDDYRIVREAMGAHVFVHDTHRDPYAYRTVREAVYRLVNRRPAGASDIGNPEEKFNRWLEEMLLKEINGE